MSYAGRFCSLIISFGALSLWSVGVVRSGEVEPSTMRVVIDARELPRKLLSATLTVPIEPGSVGEPIALWYPKWVPGSHGPGGPIANVAGVSITDQGGNTLNWRRTPGEVYRLEVEVAPDVRQIQVQVRYIANQPTVNSMGHDVFGSALVGIISPGAVLFYREGAHIDETKIATELLLPAGWLASTALQEGAPGSSPSSITFEAATLRTFVDSPIMCGRYRRIFALNEANAQEPIAPHRLHVFSESEAGVNLDSSILQRLRDMVTQTSRLVGSQPFDKFEILLAATDQLPANGLEHSRSTLNVLPRGALASPAALKGWSRLLIPHEYLHAWCGKYRRPVEMVSDDFHTPNGTELLWVYEGLTQYLGELVEARSGLMSRDEFRHRLSVELRNARHQQNRQWRPLSDTAAASHVLRESSQFWPRLRGGQDYYMEGMLFWLEVDALLRHETQGQRSLDDFCQEFFRADSKKFTAVSSSPKPFTRQEIVDSLAGLVDFDWDGLIRRRVESPQQSFDSDVAALLGYEMVSKPSSAPIPASTFRFPSGVDLYDSVGAVFSADGTVKDVLLGSVADQAKLSPGMKVLGINGRTWSQRGMDEAIESSTNSQPIELLVSDGDVLKTQELQYYGGHKYLALTRDESRDDLLEAILEAR